jgi:hypothetical protein
MRDTGNVRVVGEDQPLTRTGIVTVLEESGFDVVGVAADAPDLLRKARAHKPDVVSPIFRCHPVTPTMGSGRRNRYTLGAVERHVTSIFRR